MAYQPFLIAPYSTGVDTGTEPWLLPKDAFQELIDGYIHHGVLRKRNGIQFFGDLVHSPTTAVTAITNADPGQVTVAVAAGLANGQFFQIRGAIGMTEINDNTYKIANLVGNTFDITDQFDENVDTSAFGVYGGGGSLYPVPRLPVMGIFKFIDTNNVLQILAFDTERGCVYNASTGVFDPLDTADIFNGTPSSFVSAGAFGKTSSFGTSTFFFSNFNGNTGLPISPIWTFTTGNTTTQFTPDTTPTAVTRNYVIAAQFIFPIRQRLLLLNTVESDTLPAGSPPTGTGTSFRQRMRWCRAGNPAASGSNWDEITPGNGGFVDAPTSESIVGAKFIQDLIIVYFTNSVWKISPTADPALPYRWDKINDFRACDAAYATIGHDRFSIAFGQRGIFATDSIEVRRIDDKIENFMINAVNAEFYERMYSARNFNERRSWTLFPAPFNDISDSGSEEETSNRSLIRTEEEGAWSIYRVATVDLDPVNGTNMSCLGYAEIIEDLAWQDFTVANGFISPGSDPPTDIEWKDFGDETWASFFFQENSEVFLGGDQSGRVLFLERDNDDMGNPIGFDVTSAGWNPFKERGIQAQMGYVDFYLEADTNTKFQVEFFADDIETPYATQQMNCLPNLGFIADIQNIVLANPVSVTANSHGIPTGYTVFIYNQNGAGNLTGGPYTVTVVDENTVTLDGVDGTAFEPYISEGTLVDREFNNIKCWKRAYAGGKGYLHYLRITNSGLDDRLQFHAFMPWFREAGGRVTT